MRLGADGMGLAGVICQQWASEGACSRMPLPRENGMRVLKIHGGGNAQQWKAL